MMSTATEQRYLGSEGLHGIAAAEVAQRFLAAQQGALLALEPAMPALLQAAEITAGALGAGRRLGYAGAGSSGLMALADALELAGTFGIPPERTPVLFAGGAAALLHLRGSVEDDQEAARQDLQRSGLAAGDALIVLSASGATPYALAVAEAATARGLQVIGIASVAGSALLQRVALPVLLETGAELVAGSTRLGAATAQKAALNLISVLTGVKLGHVYEGHMVNLVADNAKLVERAARIVADVARRDLVAARAALALSGGAVKPAILIARGLSLEAAQAGLERTAGHLGPLMEE